MTVPRKLSSIIAQLFPRLRSGWLRNSTLAVAVSCALPAFANTVYLSQSGGTYSGTSGTYCTSGSTSTQVYTYFNSSSNWTSGTPTGNQIGPGTTVIVCGPLTGSAGSNVLAFQGSGASGNPITLLMDAASGALIQDPYCGTGGGACIYVSGKSYIVINGGNTGNATSGTTWTAGLVRSYANGQSGQSICPGSGSVGAPPWSASCSNFVTNVTMIEAMSVNNVTIENLGPCVGGVMNSGDSSFGNGAPGNDCIHFQGSNVTINNNQLWYDGNGVDNTTWVNGDTNTLIENNDIQENGWGIGCAGGSGSNTNYQVIGNHFHNFTQWNSEGTHVNGIHCFDLSGGGIASFYLGNNLFDGNMGSGGWTAWVYLEADGTGQNWNGADGTFYAWNNVLVGTGTVVNGNGLMNFGSGENHILVNNVFYGSGTSGATGTGPCLGFEGANITVENNVFINCTQIVATPYGGNPGPSFLSTCANGVPGTGSSSCFDYNVYSNMTGGGNNAFVVNINGGNNINTSSVST